MSYLSTYDFGSLKFFGRISKTWGLVKHPIIHTINMSPSQKHVDRETTGILKTG